MAVTTRSSKPSGPAAAAKRGGAAAHPPTVATALKQQRADALLRDLRQRANTLDERSKALEARVDRLLPRVP